MTPIALVTADDIRSRFSVAMSEMYRREVPQYGTLMELVASMNADTLKHDDALRSALGDGASQARLAVERHGAIRLGTAQELHTMRRIFAVMGMHPVGYYDLSVAGVPVHSTAFRPVGEAALEKNPFRVFTSLLRLELIDDAALRATAHGILSRRQVFTPRAVELVQQAEMRGGLTTDEADEFVHEVTQTFRWHHESTVSADVYRQLHDAHRLLADVVCFKGPHINHLTPRTLDIDAVQAAMPGRGIKPKDIIEGPPPRKVPILLRQTSFKALEEPVSFAESEGTKAGTHTARFGEVEQRGIALTHKGRNLYDSLLERARSTSGASKSCDYRICLEEAFREFPDDLNVLRQSGLAFFHYTLTEKGLATEGVDGRDLEELISDGMVNFCPIIYEDFLPVSAAGIFQSNLGGADQKTYNLAFAKAEFEAALGDKVLDEIALYEQTQALSILSVREKLRETVGSINSGRQ